jgi:lipopolysaccharide transport system ATP-binding protein
MSSDTAISVRHVSKEYTLGRTGRTRSFATIVAEQVRHPLRRSRSVRERIRALDDVTFDVAPGEAVGMIGKNGAGKSTLLKILSRITPPSDGHIEILGNVGSLLEVGTGFHPELTGLENVYLNGTILGMSKRQIDSRLEAIIDFAEIHRFLETPVKRYSSGMRVRLAFAVAAHLEPEILIVDEVLSVGDHSFQLKCLEKMRSIASDDGRTVLYVSHNLVTVEHLCERALLLVDGRLAFDGTTAETVAKYLHSTPHAERGDASGVFDLAAVDRSEDGCEVVFTQAVVRPNGGTPSEIVRMGARLQIEIAVQGLDDVPSPIVAVQVGSNTTECLFRMSSRMRPLDIAGPRRPAEKIVLDIPAIQLTPGEYHVDVGVWGEHTKLLDRVHRAAEFSVVAADFFDSGYQFNGHEGPFTVPWQWELRASGGEGLGMNGLAADGGTGVLETSRATEA